MHHAKLRLFAIKLKLENVLVHLVATLLSDTCDLSAGSWRK